MPITLDDLTDQDLVILRMMAGSRWSGDAKLGLPSNRTLDAPTVTRLLAELAKRSI